jgi:hypothetical protein
MPEQDRAPDLPSVGRPQVIYRPFGSAPRSACWDHPPRQTTRPAQRPVDERDLLGPPLHTRLRLALNSARLAASIPATGRRLVAHMTSRRPIGAARRATPVSGLTTMRLGDPRPNPGLNPAGGRVAVADRQTHAEQVRSEDLLCSVTVCCPIAKIGGSITVDDYWE